MRLKHLSYLQHALWFTVLATGFCIRRDLLEPGIGYPIMVTSGFMLAACWHILRPRYRDYIYEPKREEELPAAARSAWDAYLRRRADDRDGHPSDGQNDVRTG